MEQTLQALGGIFLKAIPTIVLVVFLYIYLRIMLFGPLQKTLQRRDQLTAGAKKTAEDSLAAAERKAAEYEAKLAEARSEVYKQQEETRKAWLADQAAQVAEARGRVEAQVKQARFDIAGEAAAARQNLLDTSGVLADQIASMVLGARAR